ncbi:hypothetical protein ACLKA6_003187 [Drosophila palustris]
MTELLKKRRNWSWGEEQEDALHQLKERLTTAPVLACPDFSANGHRRRDLKECHDVPTAGHQGVTKTVARLSQRYYWPGMFREAARYVKRCDLCQKLKCDQRKPAGQMLTRQVSEPMAALCTDFVGPLPRSKRGNTMLLVFHDAFSKIAKLISPNIVRLVRDGERKKRVANVMQLKPFFQDEEEDDQELPSVNPDEMEPGRSKNVTTAEPQFFYHCGRQSALVTKAARWMDPEDIIEISDEEEEEPWPEVQVEDGSSSGTEPERVGSDDSRPRQEPRSGPSYRDPRRERPFYGQQRREERRREYRHTIYRGSLRTVDHYDGLVVCMTAEYSTMFMCKGEEAKKFSRRKGNTSGAGMSNISGRGPVTHSRAPADQREPKAPSPTDSELLRDMLEGWNPELDAEVERLRNRYRRSRFKVADEDAEYTVTITAA